MRVPVKNLRWNDDPKKPIYKDGAQPGDTVVYQGKELRITAMTRFVYILMEPNDGLKREPFKTKINILPQ